MDWQHPLAQHNRNCIRRTRTHTHTHTDTDTHTHVYVCCADRWRAQQQKNSPKTTNISTSGRRSWNEKPAGHQQSRTLQLHTDGAGTWGFWCGGPLTAGVSAVHGPFQWDDHRNNGGHSRRWMSPQAGKLALFVPHQQIFLISPPASLFSPAFHHHPPLAMPPPLPPPRLVSFTLRCGLLPLSWNASLQISWCKSPCSSALLLWILPHSNKESIDYSMNLTLTRSNSAFTFSVKFFLFFMSLMQKKHLVHLE